MDDEATRIRFVTERFADLQGLRRVPVVLAGLWYLWVGPYARLLTHYGPAEVIPGLLLLLGPYAFLMAGGGAFDGYYSRRFGLVAYADREWRDLVIGGALAAALAVDLVLDGAGYPSALLGLLGARALGIVLRDSPWRLYYIVEVLGCLLLARWLPTLTGLSSETWVNAVRLPISTVLLVFVSTALLDHLLLARTLPRNSATERQPETARGME